MIERSVPAGMTLVAAIGASSASPTASGDAALIMPGGGGARGFLAALQLGDSLFPSGGFTLSHGLETLAERGLVRNAAELHEWLAMTLARQIAPSDGVAAAAAWDARDDPAASQEIDALLLATKLAREPREASVRTGRQLLAILTTLVGESDTGPRHDRHLTAITLRSDERAERASHHGNATNGTTAGREDTKAGLMAFRNDVLTGRTPGTHAVVLGLAGRALGLGRRETVLLLLHLHVAGCIGAALRLLDVDDVEMQRIRLTLIPTLCAATDAALATPWKEMYACAPQTELMTMLHERATVRLFAT